MPGVSARKSKSLENSSSLVPPGEIWTVLFYCVRDEHYLNLLAQKIGKKQIEFFSTLEMRRTSLAF
jgi:hypothetical protein